MQEILFATHIKWKRERRKLRLYEVFPKSKTAFSLNYGLASIIYKFMLTWILQTLKTVVLIVGNTTLS